MTIQAICELSSAGAFEFNMDLSNFIMFGIYILLLCFYKTLLLFLDECYFTEAFLSLFLLGIRWAIRTSWA